MKRLLSTVVTLLLFLAPALAQETAKSVDDFKTDYATTSQVMLEGETTGLIDTLEKTYAAVQKAKTDAEAAAEDQALQEALAAAEVALENARHKATAIADLIDDKGGETSDIRQALMGAGGDILDMNADAALGLVAKWIDQGKTWVVEDGPGWIAKIIIFLVILLVFKVLGNILGGITRKALSTSKLNVSDLLRKFFVNIVRKVVLLVGLMIALGSIGFDIGPILAGVGVIGFVVGFALQDTLSNFASGIMILIYRPYDIGDWITAAGETGRVDAMSLVSTTIMTGDNQKLIVPNSSIWGGTIRNITSQKTRRVDMTIGVGYGDDLDKAQKVLEEIVTGHEKVLDDPAPVVKVANLGESSVDFIVRPWVKASDYWDVFWDMNKTIKQRLDAEGISIPFPQRDLHLVEIPEGLKQSS